MSLLLAVFASMSGGAAAISWSGTAWNNVGLVHPTIIGTTNTVTATFSGGSRTLTATAPGNGVDYTLSYSLNGGAFTTYSSGFSISTGDTLAWRISGASADFSDSVTVTDSATGALTGSFLTDKTGSP